MKFYLASSFKKIDIVRALASRLTEEGYEHTYDWTRINDVQFIEQLSSIGEQEKEAVKRSDFLVLVLPSGKSSHIEFGIALGLGKRIYLYSTTDEIFEVDQTSTFYHVEGVERYVGELEDFVGYLVKKAMLA